MLALLTMLACAPKYSHLEPMAPDQLWSPWAVKHIDVDGVDIAYVDSGGDGPPIVFIHGLSSYLSFWEYQLDHYKGQGYRVLALDLPGFGQSGRPDGAFTPPWYAGLVAGWMDKVMVPEAVVVGHSMGGQVAVTLGLDHKDRVSALILSAPAGIETFTAGEASWMKSFWTEDRALKASEIEVRTNFSQAAFNRVDAGVERLIEERVRMGKHPSFQGTSVAVARSVVGMVEHPVRARLGELDVPTLLIYGTVDKMIPNPVFHGGSTRTIAQQGHRGIRGSELVLLPGAGHTVHHDDAEGWNAAVDAFLTKLPKKGPRSNPWAKP